MPISVFNQIGTVGEESGIPGLSRVGLGALAHASLYSSDGTKKELPEAELALVTALTEIMDELQWVFVEAAAKARTQFFAPKPIQVSAEDNLEGTLFRIDYFNSHTEQLKPNLASADPQPALKPALAMTEIVADAEAVAA